MVKCWLGKAQTPKIIPLKKALVWTRKHKCAAKLSQEEKIVSIFWEFLGAEGLL